MTDLEKARNTIDDIDREMARLFEERMNAVCQVAAYKRANNLPFEDAQREATVLANNIGRITNEEYRLYYARFLKSVMKVAKDMQGDLSDKLYVATSLDRYPIVVSQAGIHRVGELFNLKRKVLVVTDSGVPEDYVVTVASQCEDAIVFVFEQGETSKTMDTHRAILQILVDNEFTRDDCIVAVGGGVVGDVAGFAAATYMRGVDFYNIPTTILAQTDASVGGKTAINFDGYKNLIGAFYPPQGVLIDINVLQTLSRRHIANGMAEIIKMALTSDVELFELLESVDELNEEILYRALTIKKQIVEADEYEGGCRKVLNFGHTLGHAIESVSHELLHGECVAAGLLPMCHPTIRRRVECLLHKWGLPSDYSGNLDSVIDACRHDKKVSGEMITLVTVPDIGKNEIRTIPFTEFEEWYRGRRYYEKYIWE